MPAPACRSRFPNGSRASTELWRVDLAIKKPPQQLNTSFDARLLAFDTDEGIKEYIKMRIEQSEDVTIFQCFTQRVLRTKTDEQRKTKSFEGSLKQCFTCC